MEDITRFLIEPNLEMNKRYVEIIVSQQDQAEHCRKEVQRAIKRFESKSEEEKQPYLETYNNIITVCHYILRSDVEPLLIELMPSNEKLDEIASVRASLLGPVLMCTSVLDDINKNKSINVGTRSSHPSMIFHINEQKKEFLLLKDVIISIMKNASVELDEFEKMKLVIGYFETIIGEIVPVLMKIKSVRFDMDTFACLLCQQIAMHTQRLKRYLMDMLQE